jgi:hypothetical protein
VQLGDKLFTVVTPPTLSNGPTLGAGKVAFETSPPLPTIPDLWQVNIDWQGAGLPGPIIGFFEYTVQINVGTNVFESIGLSGSGDYKQPGPGIESSTLNKTVYQGLLGTGTPIDSVTSIAGAANYSKVIGGTQIFVRDTWNVLQGDTIDNLSNYIRQAPAPGPLPWVALPVGLGWSRRLRNQIKKSTQNLAIAL